MKNNSPKETPGFHSGRPTPKPEKVRKAVADKGAHTLAVKKQTDGNLPGIPNGRK